MPTTTNYGWTTPADTDLVKDGAAAIRTLGSSIDSTLKTQIDAQIPDSLLTTKGDLIAATGASTPARLGVGTNDTVLVADSTTATGLKWAVPASGSMTLLSTTTLTGASVSISSIPQSYKKLYFVIRNFLPSSDGAQMRMRFNADATINRHLNDSFYTQFYYSTGFTFNSTSSLITTEQDNVSGQGFIWIEVPDYTNTTTWKTANFSTFTNSPATSTQYQYLAGSTAYNQLGAISSMTFLPNIGNFTSGTILLYGVN